LCISWIIKCLIINTHLQTLLLANVLGNWKIDTTPKAKKVKKGKQKALRSVRNDIASCQEDGDSGVPPNVGNVSQTRHATEHFNTTSFNKLLTAAYFCTSLQSHRKSKKKNHKNFHYVVLKQLNPIQNLISHLSKIRFNIILPSFLRFTK